MNVPGVGEWIPEIALGEGEGGEGHSDALTILRPYFVARHPRTIDNCRHAVRSPRRMELYTRGEEGARKPALGLANQLIHCESNQNPNVGGGREKSGWR